MKKLGDIKKEFYLKLPWGIDKQWQFIEQSILEAFQSVVPVYGITGERADTLRKKFKYK
jgi:hypothetical protein